MALVRGPYGTSQIKGSIGGVTFQQSPFGLVARNRTTPVNPATGLQQSIRGYLGQAAIAWLNLSDEDRIAWAVYGSEVAWSNAFGDPVHLTGRMSYIRTWVATRVASGALPNIGTPPAMPSVPTGFAQLLIDNIQYSVADGFNYQGTPLAAGQMGTIWARLIPNTRNFWKGPYSYMATIDFAGPYPMENIFGVTLVAGQKWALRCTFVDSNGNVSKYAYQTVTIP